MVRNGVIVAKLAIIEEYLKKLQEYFPVSLEQFKSDWGLQKDRGHIFICHLIK